MGQAIEEPAHFVAGTTWETIPEAVREHAKLVLLDTVGVILHPGDQLWEYIAEGAGHGDPLDRDPDAVQADVLDGKVSRETAQESYGVVLTPEARAVDEIATKERRAALRAEREAIGRTFDGGADGRVR
jgi:N-methylhydantoinase B/oxoprolinase/acetone carboxylase alpha subunit